MWVKQRKTHPTNTLKELQAEADGIIQILDVQIIGWSRKSRRAGAEKGYLEDVAEDGDPNNDIDNSESRQEQELHSVTPGLYYGG